MKFLRNSSKFRTNFTRICVNFVHFVRFIAALLHPCSRSLNWCVAHFVLPAGPVPCVVPGDPAPRPAAVHAAPSCALSGEESEAAHGTGGGRAPSKAANERSEASARSGRTAGGRSEASSGAGRGHGAGREVIVPMPSREDLGTAHLDPPVARVTLAARQLDQARQ